ncbi:hypothetical protein A3D77_00480 [Candidatus Gottesmanbacteria bacterium RIFCSPHIGHO2_02_FULL_39_11]|uniref:Uncharacterized protein n=1 Tax=Candidatus Gottesmanbacteria bacterium RIFCSPHIGHO2_02_FULL_39_11 TaxID=1798382 RepID=A0A1F5ZLI0_9BACT|nr:MAG: hypothetical protein A3D77_00480 [Candidatus Gottesmanbacteria bacterium RIFCSPHIGHO2_02_FULL_39_11]
MKNISEILFRKYNPSRRTFLREAGVVGSALILEIVDTCGGPIVGGGTGGSTNKAENGATPAGQATDVWSATATPDSLNRDWRVSGNGTPSPNQGVQTNFAQSTSPPAD